MKTSVFPAQFCDLIDCIFCFCVNTNFSRCIFVNCPTPTVIVILVLVHIVQMSFSSSVQSLHSGTAFSSNDFKQFRFVSIYCLKCEIFINVNICRVPMKIISTRYMLVQQIILLFIVPFKSLFNQFFSELILR